MPTFNTFLKAKPGRYNPNTDKYVFFYAAYALFFIRTIFIRTSSLKFAKKKKEKKKKENAKNIPEEQFIFHFFYFPKSRKSELPNVLHGIRAHVKFCSFNTFPLGMVNIYIYIVLVQFIYVKTIIIVLSCLYQYVA